MMGAHTYAAALDSRHGFLQHGFTGSLLAPQSEHAAHTQWPTTQKGKTPFEPVLTMFQVGLPRQRVMISKVIIKMFFFYF